MNCQLCQKKMEDYLGGRLPGDMMTQVEEHLKECKRCAEAFSIAKVIDDVIESEKQKEANPYISARVMSLIAAGEPDTEKTSLARRVLRPAIIAVSMAAAIMLGVVAGNNYHFSADEGYVPEELAMSDDSALEAVRFLVNE